MTTKRIRLLTAILVGSNQQPNPSGDVVEVPEGEGNSLIAVGFAEDAKGAKLTDNRIAHHVGGNTPPISGVVGEPANVQVAKTEGDAVANKKAK